MFQLINANKLFIVIGILISCLFCVSCNSKQKTKQFKISLAQWSLHKSFLGESLNLGWDGLNKMIQESPDSILKGDLDPFDFPKIATQFDINTIELVNIFYFSKVDDMAYWNAFKQECYTANVSVNLIMCDALGELASVDENERGLAIENHYKWIDIASFLEADAIRVNLSGEGDGEDLATKAIGSLKSLGKYAASKNINVLVENHGGYSSNGIWLANVMARVSMPNVGTLPDFGNFCLTYNEHGCKEVYNKYKGIQELMAYAKSVSAKSYDFDEVGNESTIDYYKMFTIIKESGYQGYIGVEFEGENLSEEEGIRKTKKLIEKVMF